MKTKIILLIASIFLLTNQLFTQVYEPGKLYVYVQDEEAIPKFIPNGEELEIILEDNDLADLFQNYDVYSFDRAFPEVEQFQLAYTYQLERVYLLSCNGDETELMQLLTEEYYAYYDFIEPVPLHELLYTPNDYHLLDGALGPNYALDIINAKDAWDITTGNSSTLIGISDLGFDLEHEDLIDKIELVISGGVPNHPHGTFVAGIAGASTDNNLGMSSIGFNCMLAFNMMGINKLLALSEAGAKVINASWGSCGYAVTNQNVIHLVSDNGTLIVAAAGNGEDSNGDCQTGGCPPDCHGYFYPASYDRVLSVTSVGNDLSHISFFDGSIHTHNDKVDVSAPGYRVISTAPNDEYWLSSGTSFAAPYVSGLAGLIYSIKPDFLPEHVLHIIKTTTQNIDHINPQFIGLIGTGLIDAHAAVIKATQIANGGGDYHVFNGQNITWGPSVMSSIN